jgi:hypothetical protein
MQHKKSNVNIDLELSLSRVNAWKAIFLDKEGELTANGRIVMDELADITYATRGGVHEVCQSTGKTLDYFNGTRDVFYHILNNLNMDLFRVYEEQKRQKELDLDKYANN